MRKDLKEKNRKQTYDQIKKIFNPEFRKNSDARVYRVLKKKKARYSVISNSWLRKKQDHLEIVLTCNTANYKDIQQNSFFLFSKLAKVRLKDGLTR